MTPMIRWMGTYYTQRTPHPVRGWGVRKRTVGSALLSWGQDSSIFCGLIHADFSTPAVSPVASKA